MQHITRGYISPWIDDFRCFFPMIFHDSPGFNTKNPPCFWRFKAPWIMNSPWIPGPIFGKPVLRFPPGLRGRDASGRTWTRRRGGERLGTELPWWWSRGQISTGAPSFFWFQMFRRGAWFWRRNRKTQMSWRVIGLYHSNLVGIFWDTREGTQFQTATEQGKWKEIHRNE